MAETIVTATEGWTARVTQISIENSNTTIQSLLIVYHLINE